jgi:hypothetical protein
MVDSIFKNGNNEKDKKEISICCMKGINTLKFPLKDDF